jgi:hypothetical protein
MGLCSTSTWRHAHGALDRGRGDHRRDRWRGDGVFVARSAGGGRVGCSAHNGGAIRRPIMSRHWHRVSQPIQKLAASMYPIMSEGMSPYEMYYVLATDEEIQRLNELNATIGVR